MKNTHFLLALVSVACLTFTGCKKNNDESPAPSNGFKEFFEKTEVKSQTFTITTDNGPSSITGEKGTKITFPEDAFTTANGTPVTGTVAIELKEIYDKSDMVLSDRPTTSDGKLLVSGGEIFIRATANGQELKLADNTNILVELAPSTVDTDMGLFAGVTTPAGFDWKELDLDTMKINSNDINWTDSGPSFIYDPSHYIFACPQLGWINCDMFIGKPSSSIKIICNGEPTISATRVYLVFKSINSVTKLSYQPGSTGWAYISGLIPIGEQVTVVAFGLKGDKEYFGSTEFTVSEDLTVNLDLILSSEEEIKTSLTSLN